MKSAKVLALRVGKVRELGGGESGEWWDKPWQSGFVKDAQDGACWLAYGGFRGDEQADRKYHGGPEKAVCAYFSGHYPYWRKALGIPDLPYGSFGENVTLDCFSEPDACIGDRFSLGAAEVQISQPRQPCWKLARRWRVKDLAVQAEQTGFTGFYFRVVRHGHVRVGDALELLERPFPAWSIERSNEIMHHSKDDLEAARELADCPLLSSSWKDSLWLRVESGAARSSGFRTGQPES